MDLEKIINELNEIDIIKEKMENDKEFIKFYNNKLKEFSVNSILKIKNIDSFLNEIEKEWIGDISSKHMKTIYDKITVEDSLIFNKEFLKKIINEAFVIEKTVKVVRDGKIIKKKVCKDGWVLKDGKCVKQSKSDSKKKSKQMKKIQKKLKGKKAAIGRKRAKSMKKHTW